MNEQEREAFEAWAISDGFDCEKNQHGRYVSNASRYAWGAWQARATLAATPAPALYVGLIKRLMMLSTRLGIAYEGGVEHFSASLEDRLYAICRGAEGLLDSMAATPAQAQQADPLHELARKSQESMWLAYLDKKAEVEELRELLAATPAPAPTDKQLLVEAEFAESYDASAPSFMSLLRDDAVVGDFQRRLLICMRAAVRLAAPEAGQGKEASK